jgi:hypothetical protein
MVHIKIKKGFDIPVDGKSSGFPPAPNFGEKFFEYLPKSTETKFAGSLLKRHATESLSM